MSGPRESEAAPTTIADEVLASHLPQPLDWSGVLAQQGYVVGIDISGDGERVVVADLHGAVVAREGHTAKRQTSQPAEVLRRLVELIRKLLADNQIKAREVLRVGVGFGGPVDAKQGLVRLAPDNRAWEAFPISATLEAQLDIPALLDNDARLAALGEMWFGAGVGETQCDLVYVHWSTGVGGGIIEDGHLLRGAETLAGEIGHTVVSAEPDARTCRCGGKGHLEAYVRGPALIEQARNLLEQEHADGRLDGVGSVFALADKHPSVEKLVDQSVQMMGISIANLIALLNPSLVVVGGSVARAGGHLIPRIAQVAVSLAMPVAAASVDIVPAVLGENSAVMGAVALGLDNLR